MEESRPPFELDASRFHGPAPDWRRCVPWVALLLGLAATLMAWNLAQDQARTRAEERFRAAADRLHRDIERRMLAYDQVLRGAASLFAASEEVKRAEWRTYVLGQGIDDHFPGIRGLGFIQYLGGDELEEFVAGVCAEPAGNGGSGDFDVHPPGPQPDYMVVKFIEPVERNGEALGLDIGHEPVRRQAAEQARDLGDAVLTPGLNLVQSPSNSPGVLLLRPVYRKHLPLATIPQRRAALEGWAHGAFQLDELMNEVLKDNPSAMGVRIRDGIDSKADGSEARLDLFKRDLPAGTVVGSPGELFKTTRALEFAHHRWDLEFTARPWFDPQETWNKPAFVGGAGLGMSLLLFGLTYAVTSTRARALALAGDITRTLRIQEEVMSASSTSITILDATRPGLSIIYANPAVERLTGYTAEELLGRDGSVLLGTERDQPGVLALRAAVQERREGHAVLRCRRKDGTLFWSEISLSPVRSRSGSVTHFISLSTDITRRTESEAQLKAAQAAAEAANQAKSEFLANMSHEIRTPLNAMLGFTDLVLDTSLDEEQRRLVLEARQSADELTRLVNDILDFSRIEAGRLDLQPEAFRLRALLDRCVAAFLPRARERHLDLDLQVHPDVPDLVRTDPLRLRQVLVNLLGNAIKFTHHGRVSLEVRPAAPLPPMATPAPDSPTPASQALLPLPEPPQGPDRATEPDSPVLLEFIVSDTGIGIHPSKHAVIFQPFTQTDNSITRRYGGTGLGLAICQRLVTLLGGDIHVDSAEGRGSRFHFIIRAQRAAESEVRPAEPEPAPAVRARRLLRVLVAEDNPVNAQLVTAFLDRLGHSVIQVPDGHQAVAAAARGEVDVVLMDLQMPGLDGLKATEQIRAREREQGGHLPIIALTAHALASNRAQCLAAGMDDYLAKPIRRGDLHAALERAYPGSAPPIPAQPPTDTSPLRTRLLTQLGGDPEAVRRIISLFLETTPPLLAALAKAADARDAGQLMRAAHTLKGSLMQLGDERARAAALLVEGAASTGQLDTALAALPGLARETARVSEDLRRLL